MVRVKRVTLDRVYFDETRLVICTSLCSVILYQSSIEASSSSCMTEYEQFNHILKNGSGSVRRKIDEEFGNTLSIKDKKSLATLIYYPEEKLDIVMQEERYAGGQSPAAGSDCSAPR